MRVLSFFLVAALALLAVSAFVQAEESDIEWIQPAFVEESTETFDASPAAWEALVARAYEVSQTAVAPSHSFVETELGLEGQLAMTVSAEGKTEAQVWAEVEMRGPSLWAEFKARFAKYQVTIDNDASRFKIFMANLITIAKKNAQSFFSQMPRQLRAVFSHLSPFSHLTPIEYKKLQTFRPASQARTLLQVDSGVDTEAEAEAEADAELDSEADADSDQAAEDALEADQDAAASSSFLELPAAGQACGTQGGTCTAQAKWCVAPKVLHRGLCSGTAICCEPPSAAAAPAVAPAAQPTLTTAPDSDFRSKSSAIKYQGQCGSCYSFAGVAVLESIWNIKKGQLLTLSPQQLMDCTYPGRGCDGGDPQEAMESLVNHGTALTEAQNPFKAAPTAKCSYGAAGAPRPASTTYAITPQQAKPDENAAGIYLAQNGPLVASVDASAMQFYKGGVMTNSDGCSSSYDKVDHAVVIEGLVTDPTTHDRAWIIRNSWSADWGEHGRVRLAYGSNTCSVGSYVTKIVV